MKYLISLAFLLCSYIAYGQDLIVTTTGDSLKCKIVEVGADEIQFRFNTDGNVVSIKRSETASYKYNFVPASEKTSVGNKNAPVKQADPIYDTPKNTERKEKKAQSEGDFPRYYVGLMGGFPLLAGLNAAYFFNHHIGLGFSVNYWEEQISGYNTVWTNRHTFYGPVFYGHWGRRNGKFIFHTDVGIGALSEKSVSDYYNNYNATYFAVFGSVGIYYRPIPLISFGPSFDFFIPAYPQDPAITLGVNFHF